MLFAVATPTSNLPLHSPLLPIYTFFCSGSKTPCPLPHARGAWARAWLRSLVTSATSALLSIAASRTYHHKPCPHIFVCSLYKLNLLSPSACAPLPIASLLLRIYGAGTEKLIDRSVELSLLDHLAVHAPEIAPTMYVAFANGRLEQFIEGARTLEAADMRHPSTSALIAQTMARLHSLPLPSSATPQPACWSLIESWLNGEKDSLLLEQGSTEPALQLQRLQTVQDALKLAHELLPLLRDDPTVLCHNDLLCGNILQEIGGDRLYLIDYECSPPCCPALAPFTLLLQVRRRQLCRIRHGKPLRGVASV